MNIKNIIFDFDGVIIDSMHIRDYGFRKIFRNYPKEKVEKLIRYHRLNGGLSRFDKIKYFYNTILEEEISDDKLYKYTEEFSIIMKDKLISEDILIHDSIKFISKNYNRYNFHIASGSEENELNYICNKLNISSYFKSIYGSPMNKVDIVKKIINENNYKNEYTILIGDSINDYEASLKNKIRFIGYNNELIRYISYYYIDNFD